MKGLSSKVMLESHSGCCRENRFEKQYGGLTVVVQVLRCNPKVAGK